MYRIILFAAVLPALFLSSCLDQVGGEGQPCNQEGLCQPGLVCSKDNKCIKIGSVECIADAECPLCQWCDGSTCEFQAAGDDLNDDCQSGECLTGACDGAGACGFEPDGTDCGDPSDTECTLPDKCDGNSRCLTNHMPSGTPCGDQGVLCHKDDTCDGAGTCFDRGLEPDGTPCPDNLFCNGAETCDDAGTCQPGPGDPCTPPTVCNEAQDTCTGCNSHIDCPVCMKCNFGTNDCEHQLEGEDIKNECDPTECLTDSCDGAGACGPEPEGKTCGDNTDNECDNPDTCDGNGNCALNQEVPGTPCGDQSDTDCDNPDSCDGLGSCSVNHEPQDTPCPDDVFCNGVETCDGSGNCQTGPGDPCVLPTVCNEDQDACVGCNTDADCTLCMKCNQGNNICENQTASEDLKDDCDPGECVTGLCDGAGACGFEPVGTPCGDQGVECYVDDTCDGVGNCFDNGFSNAGTPCTDISTDDCQEARCDGNGFCDQFYETKQEGEPCGDGLDCTIDTCDGNGNCLSMADPALCTAPDLCLPECAVDGTGCVAPPDPFTISCATPSGAPPTSSCNIDASGLTNQESCLSCQVEIGETVLDYSDFTQDGLVCDLDGWELRSRGCRDRDTFSCSQYSGSDDCCAQLDRICSIDNGEGIVGLHRMSGCLDENDFGKGFKMFKTFNTSGYRDLVFCFDTMENYGSDLGWILVNVYDTGHPLPGEQVYCQSDGPGIDDGHWFQICRELPTWAWNNPAVSIIFILHSNRMGSLTLNLRRFSLFGMSMECPLEAPVVMTEDFQGCPAPLPADWNGWDVNGTAYCGGFAECYQNIPGYQGVAVEARNSNFTLTKYVDASSLDDRVTLCFWYGDEIAGTGESLEAQFDAGSGWISAWLDQSDMGPDRSCKQTCVNLSEMDPAVNNNPNLGIRFTATSDSVSNPVDLAGIELSGHVFCDGAGKVSLSNPVDMNDGTYDFDATNLTGSDLTARIRCEWGPTDPPQYSTTEVRFPP